MALACKDSHDVSYQGAGGGVSHLKMFLTMEGRRAGKPISDFFLGKGGEGFGQVTNFLT